MRWPRLLSLILALAALLENTLAAEDPTSPDSTTLMRGRLTIESTPEGAHVVLDGKGIGFTPISIDSISPGIHALTLQHPEVESWLAEPSRDSVLLADGEQKVVRYDLRIRYLITSRPFGAEVVMGDSVIGTTPFVTAPTFGQQQLTLRKPGYETTSVQLVGQSQQGILSIPMKKVWQKNGNGETIFSELDGNDSEPVSLYISGAATVFSGVAAAYLKTKADDRYQQYLRTNDGKYLDQTHRLDTAAGIAIAATQIGLGLFTFFLFSI